MQTETWLVAILTTFAVTMLAIFARTMGNPSALTALSTLAALLAIPMAGLVPLLLIRLGTEKRDRERDARSEGGGRSPIFVIGNGSTDVRVEAGPDCVRVFVGGPAFHAGRQLGAPDDCG